jgi:hypothetical protein
MRSGIHLAESLMSGIPRRAHRVVFQGFDILHAGTRDPVSRNIRPAYDSQPLWHKHLDEDFAPFRAGMRADHPGIEKISLPHGTRRFPGGVGMKNRQEYLEDIGMEPTSAIWTGSTFQDGCIDIADRLPGQIPRTWSVSPVTSSGSTGSSLPGDRQACGYDLGFFPSW